MEDRQTFNLRAGSSILPAPTKLPTKLFTPTGLSLAPEKSSSASWHKLIRQAAVTNSPALYRHGGYRVGQCREDPVGRPEQDPGGAGSYI